MSFMLTTPQFRARTKRVTRRLGWIHLKAGDVVMGVEKAQGLKRGETVVHLGPIRIKSVREEPLREITIDDCVLEGFPDMLPDQFIAMFCNHNKGCTPGTLVNRIEFEYV